MDENTLAVNSSCSHYGIADALNMKFLGRTEIATFVTQYPSCAEDLRVWLAEVENVTWANAGALLEDYPRADVSRLPTVIFYLGVRRLRVESLVEFRIGVVLLRNIAPPATAVSDHIQEDGTAYREY